MSHDWFANGADASPPSDTNRGQYHLKINLKNPVRSARAHPSEFTRLYAISALVKRQANAGEWARCGSRSGGVERWR